MARLERWLPLMFEDYLPLEGYEISDRGRIRSFWVKAGPKPYLGTRSILRPPMLVRGGYHSVTLRTSRGKYQRYSVHRLCALTFLGPPPRDCTVVVHLNRDRTDNRLENLAWAPMSRACVMAVEDKPRRPLAKLRATDIPRIRASRLTARELAVKYGVGKRAIYDIRWGRTWRDA